jgi:xanthine dehydrogenase YagR molybdenum-binding subunit
MPLGSNPDRPRFDAHQKVLGHALYAADRAVPGLLHAMTVPAAIAKGEIEAIDTDAAAAVRGVVRVFTWRDFADLIETGATRGGGGQRAGYQPMKRPSVRHRGEAVALVVAETLEAAIEGAEAVAVRYRPAPFTGWYDQPGAEREAMEVDVEAGDAQGAFEAAPHRLDVSYVHSAQHHNALEMISTTVAFIDGKIIVMEGTQNSDAFKAGLSGMLALSPAMLEGSSPYLGGGFGQKNGLQEQTALAVKAAMLLHRPIKLVMPRAQLFHTVHHRPFSLHRMRIGAGDDGRLAGVVYDTQQQNSRYDGFGAGHGEHVSRMYATPNWRSTGQRIRIDTQPVAHQRAPKEAPSSFATECAYDEMAYTLGIDPVAFRLTNDAARDPIDGKPFSSRYLDECLQRGAARFGWSDRNPEPRSMRTADGMLVGWGMAAGAYHTGFRSEHARLRLNADGSCRIAIGGHEMGQGIRSVVAAELIDVLEIDPARLTIELGDTAVAPQSITVGSWGTPSAAPATRAAALRLRDQLVELAGPGAARGPAHLALARVRRPYLEVEITRADPGGAPVLPPGQAPVATEGSAPATPAGAPPPPRRPESPYSTWSWIAHFAEVHVHPDLGRVRVRRVVSTVDCGRVMNQRTARSQIHGGITWGIGAALFEAGEVDPRFGRVLNNDLADYLIPTNADIGEIDVEFIDRPDPLVNVSGAKGAGEVAVVGVAAAVLNAIFHATGRRLRHMPVRVEDLI